MVGAKAAGFVLPCNHAINNGDDGRNAVSDTWISLAVKVGLTPVLIALVSLAGRRWGTTVSGWLVGLPLTSGPIIFILASERGTAFAAKTSEGTLTGCFSEVAFCLAYGWCALRFRWPIALAASFLAFALSTAALQHVFLPSLPLFALAVCALALSIRLMPSPVAEPAAGTIHSPPWDIPARMIVATALVLALTSVAPALGPHLTGLIAPFPVYVTTLTVFAHRLQGSARAIDVLKGLLFGLFAFASFLLVLATLLTQVGIAPAFALAIVAALAIQGISLWVLRRPARSDARQTATR
jgi:uncharacterized membrane protein (GlpM family)